MNLSPRLYKEAIKTVESAILSTDLALYFKKKGSFSQMIEGGEKNWIELEKRETLRYLTNFLQIIPSGTFIIYRFIKMELFP